MSRANRSRLLMALGLLSTAAVLLCCSSWISSASPREGSRRTSSSNGDGDRVGSDVSFARAYFSADDAERFANRKKKKKVLLGIFTVIDRPKERDRRRLIRETYLSDPYGRGRICHLPDYVDLLDGGEFEKADDCEVVYAFIAGRADTTIPTDHFRTDRPLTVEREHNPERLVMLNVRDNLAEGKSYAYLKWAARTALDRGFDYVVKTDDDTLISVPHLFEKIIAPLPPFPHNRRYYGGHVTDAMQCNVEKWEHCRHATPNGYMAGQFYLLSPDLAYAVSSDDVERPRNTRVEDLDMGRAVFAWSRTRRETINMFTTGGVIRLWNHPVKDTNKWLTHWKRYKERRIPYVW